MTELLELKREAALACRVIASAGLSTPLLGHVSIRLSERRMLVRCRGPLERGLRFTTVDDVRETDLEGTFDDADGYRLPNEFPIHAEILRARPEVDAVLHAHPESALLGGLADVPIRPVFGAFSIPAFRMADRGVPVHEHRGLVRDADSGRALALTLAGGPAVLLRGHGIVTVGAGAAQALARALALDELLRVCVELARLGADPTPVSGSDRQDLPDLGADFNERALWRYHVAELEREGLADVG